MSDKLTFVVSTATGLKDLYVLVKSLHKVSDLPYVVTIEGKAKHSTVAQRNFYHIVCRQIAEHTGHTEHEIIAFAKDRFLEKRNVVVGDTVQQVPPDLRDLSSKKMADFIEQILAFASLELNLNIVKRGDFSPIGERYGTQAAQG